MATVAAALLASSAGAATLAPDEFTVEGIVARMDDATYAEREAATDQLMALLSAAESTGSPMVERVLERGLLQLAASPETTLEQSARLLTPIRKRWEMGPHGAIGIQFGDLNAPGATIGRTVPGFPAHDLGLIKAGDVITHIDGQELNGGLSAIPGFNRQTYTLRKLVISRDPGEVLKLRILRAGAVIEVDVPLGTWEQLGNGPQIEPETLEAAWALRLSRAGFSPDRTNGRKRLMWKVDPTVWGKHNRVRLGDKPVMLASVEVAPGAAEDITFALEGLRMAQLDEQGAMQANGWIINRRQVDNPPGVIRQMIQQQQNRGQKEPMIKVARPRKQTDDEDVRGDQAREIDGIIREQKALEDKSNELSRRLADPALGPEQRVQVREQIREVVDQMSGLDERLRALLQPRIGQP